MWSKLKAWFNDAVLIWKMDTVRALLLITGGLLCAYYSWQHLQFLEYCLGGLVFGYAIVHGLVLFFSNPVKDEMKIQKLVRLRQDVEAGFLAEEDVVLHLKHLLEKHLGHPVTITAAPAVVVPQPTPQA